jgi:hypothetical protein
MHGKWLQPGVPKKSYSFTGDIEDLGAPDGICEICETQQIRPHGYSRSGIGSSTRSTH